MYTVEIISEPKEDKTRHAFDTYREAIEFVTLESCGDKTIFILDEVGTIMKTFSIEEVTR